MNIKMIDNIEESKINTDLLHRLDLESLKLQDEIFKDKNNFQKHIDNLEKINFNESDSIGKYIDHTITINKDARKIRKLTHKFKENTQEQLSIIFQELVKVEKAESDSVVIINKVNREIEEINLSKQKIINALLAIIAALSVSGYLAKFSLFHAILFTTCLLGLFLVNTHAGKKISKCKKKLLQVQKYIIDRKQYKSIMYKLQATIGKRQRINDKFQELIEKVVDTSMRNLKRAEGSKCQK